MVKHIVMWRLKAGPGGIGKADAAREVKERLETLPQNVPGILQLEVGVHLGPDTDGTSDLVLTTAFRDRAALRAYDVHPEHEKVKPFVKERTVERRCVDYEI